MSLLKEKIELSIEETELAAQKKLEQMPPVLRWLLIIGVISIIPAYFLARVSASIYWDSVYKKQAISAKPSFQNPKRPSIGEVSIAKAENGFYSAAVEITNENLELSLNLVPYAIEFYNSRNELVYTYPEKSSQDRLFLLPDQKKILVAPRIPASEPIASASLKLPEDLPWQKRLRIPEVKIQTSVPQTYSQADPPAFAVEGSFTNSSAYQLKKIRLIFMLYDRQGRFLAASQRDEFSVMPSERRSYKLLWPGISAASVGKTTISAETNVLDEANLSVPNSVIGPESSLDRPSGGIQF